ncbi:MAG: hypothetical protein GTN53_10605 [Candidatus Aminicenantes bacterium]|nr:hypothetical protein [Candidatus Aminicenantes bacterium]NIQ66902.1 hypothetical protein [Candidatus Aminicenantes bacterium]NIT22945.1 hypothetical protein [Candidatus Aminicenantes bacterium]
MSFKPFQITILAMVLCLIFSSTSFGKIDAEIFSNIKPRSIGPANMSGRIGDVQVVISNPNIIYVGAATGGVWKSEDGGLNWKPIFDDQPASSIGALAICRQNPNIVWVGTGEANPRNSVGVGRGVFKSLDAGKTWINLGLAKTEKISRIILDPHSPDVAYAAALGTTWGENPERGVFKTFDGGKSWEKVLYVDQKTGAADLAMAPDNPNKLIAAMWEHRRWPWFFNSGGPGSGLFITTDGGKNWKKLTHKDGLPKGDLGRIGIAFATNKPNIVYALVEAKKNVLLRSEDGGFTWRTVNNKEDVSGRPFYYSDIRVNPQNENIVYSLQSNLLVSEDGGKNFERLTNWGQAHPDYHAMWIHPDGEYMVVGNDGGIVISRDRGKTWRFARNLPLGQFYHISYDMELPYNVYGGLQDNGSWMGPSSVLTDRGIYNYHWRRVGGGDGFDTEPDPENKGCGYAMSQGGSLFYFDVNTGMSKTIRPTETDVKHRYNWNAGLAIDPFEPSTIYYGSQFVHCSRDRGHSWEIISPDLTTNDPEKQKQAESGGLTLDVTAAENHTTILCIAPSPVKKGVIWVGTDDGNVQLTTDEGKTWQLVSQPLTGTKKKKGKVPYGTFVPHVEASKFNEACAFVVFDDHRRANWTPYVFVTENYGKTWKSLVTKDIDGFVHVIEQDHKNKDLLFLGTEFGLYFSMNRGKEWTKWTSGFPTVPVRDLAVHPRDNDLVIGTHGRSIYILDDISFLREIQPDVLKKKAYLFKAADTSQFRRSSASSYSTQGDTEFTGPNPPSGAMITYFYIPDEKGEKEDEKETDEMDERMSRRREMMERMGMRPGMFGERGQRGKPKIQIEILDKDGNVIRKLQRIPFKKGINRTYWDLRQEGLDMSALMRRRGMPAAAMRRFRRGGAYVLPGTYTVRLKAGDTEMTQTFQVNFDPRYKVDIEVLKKNQKLYHEMEGWIKAYMKANNEIKETTDMIKTVLKLVRSQDLKREDKRTLMQKGMKLQKKLKELSQKLNPESEKQGIADRSASLRMKFFRVYRSVAGAFEPITQATEVSIKKIKIQLQDFVKEYNNVFETDVEDFKKAVKESGVTFFKPFKPLSLKAEEKKKERK